jgi:DNA-binding GntR family transcriptional regulator
VAVTSDTEDKLEGGKRGKAIAFEALRGAIQRGDMVPGQRLIDSELVTMLGVTRASVRSALDDLVAEGLVERIHNRGARVREVRPDEALEILECRKALEAVIAAKAAERAADDDIVRLRALGVQMSEAVRDGKSAKYSTLNHEFHTVLAGIANHRTASELIDRLNAQIVRHQFQLSRRQGWSGQTLGQHLAIIEAVASRDPAVAEQAMHDHLSTLITAVQSAS